MTIPHHTHTFTIPTATKEDVENGTASDLAVTPDSLGKLAAKDKAGINDIQTSNTPAPDTFLKGDGSWSEIAGGSQAELHEFEFTESSGFNVPDWVNENTPVEILAWGGGGGGASNGGGGGGGMFARKMMTGASLRYDVQITIGLGGIGGWWWDGVDKDGGNGHATIVYGVGRELVRSFGGKGGETSNGSSGKGGDSGGFLYTGNGKGGAKGAAGEDGISGGGGGGANGAGGSSYYSGGGGGGGGKFGGVSMYDYRYGRGGGGGQDGYHGEKGQRFAGGGGGGIIGNGGDGGDGFVVIRLWK